MALFDLAPMEKMLSEETEDVPPCIFNAPEQPTGQSGAEKGQKLNELLVFFVKGAGKLGGAYRPMGKERLKNQRGYNCATVQRADILYFLLMCPCTALHTPRTTTCTSGRTTQR